MPPGRSRRGGSRGGRRRGSAPPPSPRNGGSGASRGGRHAGRSFRGNSWLRPWPREECTVRFMRLVEQWDRIESGLDPRWHDARLELTVDDEMHAERAAALLGRAAPGRPGPTIRFSATRGGAGVGPEAVRRFLRRIDAEGIGGATILCVIAFFAWKATHKAQAVAPPAASSAA